MGLRSLMALGGHTGANATGEALVTPSNLTELLYCKMPASNEANFLQSHYRTSRRGLLANPLCAEVSVKFRGYGNLRATGRELAEVRQIRDECEWPVDAGGFADAWLSGLPGAHLCFDRADRGQCAVVRNARAGGD